MIVQTEQEYEKAMSEIDALWDTKTEQERLSNLVIAVEAYEDIHYPFPEPSLWDRFEYWLYKKGILR